MIVKIIIAAYILINIVSFSMYGADKKKAQKSEWRIKESTLILSAFLFGGIGALAGMKVFHHKTKHTKFIVLVPLAVILNIAVIAAAYIRFR